MEVGLTRAKGITRIILGVIGEDEGGGEGLGGRRGGHGHTAVYKIDARSNKDPPCGRGNATTLCTELCGIK